MTPEKVIELLQEPKKLLRLCYLNIRGGSTRTPTLPDQPPPPPNGQAEEARFAVSFDDTKKVQGFKKTGDGLKDRVFVNITKLANQFGQPAANEFDAFYIPMVQLSDVTDGTSHYTLPLAGGPRIMITSTLTGCTFGVGSGGGSAVLVSHVQPRGRLGDFEVNLSGNQKNELAQLKRGEASNAVLGGFAKTRGLFNKGRDYEENAAVIGHREGSAWSFYLQPSKGVFTGNTARFETTYVLSRYSVL